MKKDKITDDQISRFNQAFHTLWFKIMTSRPESKSDKLKGLTFSDMHVISMAYEEPDIILKDIREKLRLPQTTLSSIVAKLEKKGFVQRVINPRDYRSFSLKITDKGTEMMAAHMELDEKQNRHILQSLEPDERQEFIRLFAKVADKFNFGLPT
jgi:DNA-binding MarR family transcriptional regulator